MKDQNSLRTKKPYLVRVLLIIDQGLNVLLLNGHEDHTISGRVGAKALTTQKWYWKLAEKIINTLFWWDPNHCYTSIEWDRYPEHLKDKDTVNGVTLQ